MKVIPTTEQPFEPTLDSQGRSWKLNEASFLQMRNMGHRKAFVPRSPTGFYSLSIPLVPRYMLLFFKNFVMNFQSPGSCHLHYTAD